MPPTAPTPPTTHLIIAYPSTDPTTGHPLTFNMTHYTTHHIPLATRLWGPRGLKAWSVTQFADPNPLSGAPPPYLVQATLRWDVAPEEVLRVVGEGAEELQADVERFADVVPVLWVGGEVARGSVG